VAGGPPAAGRLGEEEKTGDAPAPLAMGLRPRHPLLGYSAPCTVLKEIRHA